MFLMLFLFRNVRLYKIRQNSHQLSTLDYQNDIAKKTTKNKNPKLLFDENLTGTFFIK